MINDILRKYMDKLTVDRETMIVELLSHALQGDRLILVELHFPDGVGTLKYQFQWESGELLKKEYSYKSELAEAVDNDKHSRKMLADQCDMAREAETKQMAAERELAVAVGLLEKYLAKVYFPPALDDETRAFIEAHKPKDVTPDENGS